MKTAAFGMLMVAGALGANDFHDIVKTVNTANGGWTAGVPTRFNSTAQVRTLCGTLPRTHPSYKLRELPKLAKTKSDLPASFDARTAFPDCEGIALIRDQSSCGSCWAFGSTEAFEGRWCAQKGDNVVLSTEDTLSCSGAGDCPDGGFPDQALDWMSTTGVVSGGLYGSKDLCLPYSLPACGLNCPQEEYPTPSCKKECQAGYATAYADDKRVGGVVSDVDSSADAIKTALLNGPLSLAISVYGDFPTYKTGVYKHVTGDYLGGHAMAMLGWGTEDGQDYWLVKNSWSNEWGLGGTIKIGFGECGIEDRLNAVDFN